MVLIRSILLALLGVAAAVSNPVAEIGNIDVEARSPSPNSELAVRDSTPNSSGYKDGYYYFFESDGLGNATFTNGPGGSYAMTWSGMGLSIGGKGWNPGGTRKFHYSAVYRPSGNSMLEVYGWTTDPLVEYRIIENFGTYNPGSVAQTKGKYSTDGCEYTVGNVTRYNQPSIQGIKTYQQIWSVCWNKRRNGTISLSNHFDAWKRLKLALGRHNYQIFALEAYYSSGSVNVTIW
ncbi:Probable endo-1,4-beta-xylanase A Short=Xylanase A; AltName: Full=1,4-beta-D-xylan xylanohydrolase A; Flags: Precursor [Serendipita indica DSM 11827]|uniref:Endo-1,4-beta-xylanase n=1 Tax=Serendipita indica (strain DSM 11827) TaxID=1109443 RepID=G4TKT4_SERID|nr:Probable endo-1,4-beta-xylanase A Short=Xylanase A; AltName: Full=1,4-beta-D-xylan xylanohydrolase A; Flags: Precursor [Serendipita indica DSM 11827]CCA71927.1 probable endo-1,4-beta-xylanase A precursor [Serendipita indica DSM 11827]